MIRSFIVTMLSLLVLSDLRAGVDPITDLTLDRMVVLEVDATINPAVANYLQTELTRTAATESTLFVIKLNTPGGLVSTTKDIITAIGKSTRPIVVWVTPEGASATSAGAIIASSAHGLVMNRGTNIGAATPVGIGEDIKEGDGRAKAVNDLTALVRSLSTTRGRNAEAFVSMVAKAESFTAEDAAKKNITDGVVTSLDGIRALYQDKTVVIQGQKRLLKFAPIVETETREMDAGQQLLNIFANPSTAYILFILGAALLYFEFQAPGGYIAGGIGVLCLIVAGIAFQILPLNFGAMVLLIAGVAMLVLEIYVTSYGLLALAGLGCLVAGSLFLYRHEDGWITVQYSVILSTLAGIVVSLGVIAWFLTRHRVARQGFFDHTHQEGEVMRLFGQEGTHFTYQIRVHGEIWKAVSSQELSVGDRVKVNQQRGDGLLLEITKL